VDSRQGPNGQVGPEGEVRPFGRSAGPAAVLSRVGGRRRGRRPQWTRAARTAGDDTGTVDSGHLRLAVLAVEDGTGVPAGLGVDRAAVDAGG